MAERLQFLATASRGTEELLAQELKELGAQRVREDRGRVRFAAEWMEAMRVCLWTRIAERVLYPLGDFEAQGAEGLYQAARSVPWEEHLTALSSFAVDATIKDSEHTHSGFVALKIKDGMVDRLRQKIGSRPNVDAQRPDVGIVAHLDGRHLWLSLDVAGGPLHRRGYRRQTILAPLKETLAAAILRAGQFTGTEPLLDPMCGSGTLLIEGGLIAARRPPGLDRTFGAERWPRIGQRVSQIVAELKGEARDKERAPSAAIRGMDRDPAAVEAARSNVKAARLSKAIRISLADVTQPLEISDLTPGILVTNPPYGSRLQSGGQKGMKSFYFKLGESLQLKGWRLVILSGNPAFESAFHLRPSSTRILWNGPLRCQLLQYDLR